MADQVMGSNPSEEYSRKLVEAANRQPENPVNGSGDPRRPPANPVPLDKTGLGMGGGSGKWGK